MNETIHIEKLFNSVEAEFARRWVVHNVPDVFADRPVEHLRKMVKAWWQIYHESACAGKDKDRTLWERKVDTSNQSLNTSDLLASLEEIYRLLNVDAIRSYRPLCPHEEAALCLLAHIMAYYADPFPEKVRAFILNYSLEN